MPLMKSTQLISEVVSNNGKCKLGEVVEIWMYRHASEMVSKRTGGQICYYFRFKDDTVPSFRDRQLIWSQKGGLTEEGKRRFKHLNKQPNERQNE